MTHDPLCDAIDKLWAQESDGSWRCMDCAFIAKVRADERARKGTCWREVEGAQIPSGAIRVHREAGWFWEMP